MRIVYYTHTAFFEPALSLVRELAKHAEVHLLLEMTPDSWQSASFELQPQRLASGIVPADAELKDSFPAAVRAYWQGAASFHLVVHPTRRSIHPTSWRISRKVLQFLRMVGADVFHVDDVDVTPRLSLALPHLREVPLVLSIHDPEPHSGEQNWRKDLSRRIAYRRASRFVLHNTQLKQPFCERYEIPTEKAVVIPLGVYEVLTAWSDGHGEDLRPTILFFGRISPYKGIDVLYEAIPHVMKQVPNLRLVVAGRPIDGYEPPNPPSVQSPAEVQVLDHYISNAELARLFQMASVVACPYRDATQSGIVLTSFAFDKPVVASSVGGLPEYIEDGQTGLLVPSQDAEALAEALVRVIQNPQLHLSLRSGIQRAKESKLSWARAASDMLSLYDELSTSGRSSFA